MKIKGYEFRRRTRPGEQEITFKTKDLQVLDTFFAQDVPEELEVEIKIPSKKRSLDANAYFWTLADRLAKKLRTTSEEIYKELVHRVGVFDFVLVYEVAKESFIKNWSAKGLGWFCEEETTKLPGATKLRVYTGSSQYNSEQMSRLIDELISECKEAGIETITPNEKEELIQRWNVQM